MTGKKELKNALEALQEKEKEYMENMPENLQDSEEYKAAEKSDNNLEDAIWSLVDAAASIEEAIGE